MKHIKKISHTKGCIKKKNDFKHISNKKKYNIVKLKNCLKEDKIRIYFKKKFIYYFKNWYYKNNMYNNIYGISKFFGKKVLDVELKNGNRAYLDKNLKIIIEFNEIFKNTTFFNKETFFIKLGDKLKIYTINKNSKIICKFDDVLKMKNLFNEKVWMIGLKNGNNGYIDKNLKVIFEFNKIISVNKNEIIFLLDKKIYKLTKEVK